MRSQWGRYNLPRYGLRKIRVWIGPQWSRRMDRSGSPAFWYGSGVWIGLWVQGCGSGLYILTRSHIYIWLYNYIYVIYMSYIYMLYIYMLYIYMLYIYICYIYVIYMCVIYINMLYIYMLYIYTYVIYIYVIYICVIYINMLYIYYIYIYVIYICYIYICYIYICYIYMLYYIYILYIYICYIYMLYIYIYIICCIPSEVIKKTYKFAYAAFTLSFFFLPYRFAGYLHLSQSKRFMHMRPPSKKSFVQLPLTSGIHTFAAKTLLGANSP